MTNRTTVVPVLSPDIGVVLHVIMRTYCNNTDANVGYNSAFQKGGLKLQSEEEE